MRSLWYRLVFGRPSAVRISPIGTENRTDVVSEFEGDGVLNYRVSLATQCRVNTLVRITLYGIHSIPSQGPPRGAVTKTMCVHAQLDPSQIIDVGIMLHR